MSGSRAITTTSTAASGSTVPTPVAPLQTMVNQSIQSAVSGLLETMEDRIQAALANTSTANLAPATAGSSSSTIPGPSSSTGKVVMDQVSCVI